jgi:hypothetical protein
VSVRWRLGAGMTGGADFSACGRYRPALWRRWGEEVAPFALWIGMNPSTADALSNDPTIAREIAFTRREGFTTYRKCNAMDYRATKPKDLLAPGVVPCSPDNLPAIARFAAQAALVVVCLGKIQKQLAHHGDAVVTMLRSMGIEPKCLGKNEDGSPRHPLYLAADTKFEPF